MVSNCHGPPLFLASNLKNISGLVYIYVTTLVYKQPLSQLFIEDTELQYTGERIQKQILTLTIINIQFSMILLIKNTIFQSI